MSIGPGIAVAGIWIGVGLSAFGAGEATVGVAMFAMVATALVVGLST